MTLGYMIRLQTTSLLFRNQQNEKNVLILVHRRELIDQASKKLKAIGVKHGIIAANTTVLPAPVGITNKGDFLPFVLKEYLRFSIALI